MRRCPDIEPAFVNDPVVAGLMLFGFNMSAKQGVSVLWRSCDNLSFAGLSLPFVWQPLIVAVHDSAPGG